MPRVMIMPYEIEETSLDQKFRRGAQTDIGLAGRVSMDTCRRQWKSDIRIEETESKNESRDAERLEDQYEGW